MMIRARGVASGMGLLLLGFVLGSTIMSVVTAKDAGEERSPVECDHRSLTAVLWHRVAAERRALCYQTYAGARRSLGDALQMRAGQKPRAIMIDIDDTVIDTSEYQAQRVSSGISYPAGWDNWVNSGSGALVPGVKEFLLHCESAGVEVLYVSGRSESLMAGTAAKLKKEKLPFVDREHIVLYDTKKTAGVVCSELSAKYDIVMYVGDQLDDLCIGGMANIKSRISAVEGGRSMFGATYIVLPNAMYGKWDAAMYSYDYGLSDIEKRKIRHFWASLTDSKLLEEICGQQ